MFRRTATQVVAGVGGAVAALMFAQCHCSEGRQYHMAAVRPCKEFFVSLNRFFWQTEHFSRTAIDADGIQLYEGEELILLREGFSP